MNRKIPVTAGEIRKMQDGYLILTEPELMALEQQHDSMIAAGRRCHDHLRNCEHSDLQTLDTLMTLLRYIGIEHEVVRKPITQPKAEMACHHEE